MKGNPQEQQQCHHVLCGRCLRFTCQADCTFEEAQRQAHVIAADKWRVSGNQDNRIPKGQTFDKGLEWRDDDGFAIPGATFSMMTKGSSLVFEGNECLVVNETPFDLQPPAHGK